MDRGFEFGEDAVEAVGVDGVDLAACNGVAGFHELAIRAAGEVAHDEDAELLVLANLGFFFLGGPSSGGASAAGSSAGVSVGSSSVGVSVLAKGSVLVSVEAKGSLLVSVEAKGSLEVSGLAKGSEDASGEAKGSVDASGEAKGSVEVSEEAKGSLLSEGVSSAAGSAGAGSGFFLPVNLNETSSFLAMMGLQSGEWILNFVI